MASTTMAQALPILTLVTVATADAEEKSGNKPSTRARAQTLELLTYASDATCSTGSASDRSEGSDASDVSDNESSLVRSQSSDSTKRWADYESDDEDKFFEQMNKSSEVQLPQRTPLNSCGTCFVPQSTGFAPPSAAEFVPQYAADFVPQSAAAFVPQSSAAAFVPQSMAIQPVSGNTRLDFGKIVAAGLMAMRNSETVASADVKEESGSGWTLTGRLQPDVEEKFTAIKTITQHVQQALLQSAEVSEKSYIIGYEAEPFAPLGLGFSLHIASVADDTEACWDFIGTGYCSRGCRCRWKHPAEKVRVDVHLRLGVGSE